jgi:hypothetical protein
MKYWRKSIKYLLITFLISSCYGEKKIVGSYKLENPPTVQKVIFNKDKTFYFSVGTDLCYSGNFWGYWRNRGRILFLDYVWPNISNRNKSDLIIAHYYPSISGTLISIHKNENRPADSIEVYINDLLTPYVTNNNGYIILNDSIQVRKIKVKEWFGTPKEFIINKVHLKSNYISIMLYDYTFEPCIYNYLQNKFKVTKDGLVPYLHNEYVKHNTFRHDSIYQPLMNFKAHDNNEPLK